MELPSSEVNSPRQRVLGKAPQILVGGQAVWEGVLMRSPKGSAMAVRQPSGTVFVQSLSFSSLADAAPLFRWPILRGIAALWDSLALGLKALNLSLALGSKPEEKLSKGQAVFSLALALGLVVLLFFVAPFFLSRLLSFWLPPRLLAVVEGFLRLGIFFAYLWFLSLIPEVKRVLYQYHGAEHKVVHTFEHGEPLTVENARKFSPLHPRCSTSFLLVVLIVSFVLFVFLDFPSTWWRFASRILFLPLIAGFSFELIRLFTLYPRSFFARVVVYPGLATQKLTTAEPSSAQLEVAIAALQASLGLPSSEEKGLPSSEAKEN
ncbi:MAG: DUF1385 domain-containing protein [Coprothermobacterota bacterium]|nr:DUF1385 domain-containing protein [Coprothermobacterota bacterium]